MVDLLQDQVSVPQLDASSDTHLDIFSDPSLRPHLFLVLLNERPAVKHEVFELVVVLVLLNLRLLLVVVLDVSLLYLLRHPMLRILNVVFGIINIVTDDPVLLVSTLVLEGTPLAADQEIVEV